MRGATEDQGGARPPLWKTPAHPSQAGVSFNSSTLRRFRGCEFAQRSAREYGYWRRSALEVDSAKRTAAEPDPIRARAPRTFGDVLGVPAPHRWRCMPLADCVPV